jgi:hypothetical protein
MQQFLVMLSDVSSDLVEVSCMTKELPDNQLILVYQDASTLKRTSCKGDNVDQIPFALYGCKCSLKRFSTTHHTCRNTTRLAKRINKEKLEDMSCNMGRTC